MNEVESFAEHVESFAEHVELAKKGDAFSIELIQNVIISMSQHYPCCDVIEMAEALFDYMEEGLFTIPDEMKSFAEQNLRDARSKLKSAKEGNNSSEAFLRAWIAISIAVNGKLNLDKLLRVAKVVLKIAEREQQIKNKSKTIVENN